MARATRLFVLVLASVGLLAAPAAAVPPVHQELVIHNVVQDDGQACGFPVRWEINIEARQTSFFDRDGNLVRQQIFVREYNTVENLETGLVLDEGPDSFVQRVDFEEDGSVTITTTGLSVFIPAGTDTVIDAGRFVVSQGPGGTVLLHSAGQHEPRLLLLEGGFPAVLGAFCDVLS